MSEKAQKNNKNERVLIHACCADCLSKIITDKTIEEFEKEVYFYNPNIHPRSEYLARLKAIQGVCLNNNIKLTIADWSPKEYFNAIKELQTSKSIYTKQRCLACWRLRIGMSLEYAIKSNFHFFTSTLLTSHYMDHDKIIEIAKDLLGNREIGMKLIVPSIECCDVKTGGFYKQNYCGCIYSLLEKYNEKFFHDS